MIQSNCPILIEARDQAPAPSKDYAHLRVTTDEVLLTVIPINPRCLKFPISPKTLRLTFYEYLEDASSIQQKIEHYFPSYYDRVRLICKGHHDPLTILPHATLINILQYLDLEDIVSVAQVSGPLKDFCETDELWEVLYNQHLSASTMSDEMRALASDIGWKKFYFSRVINRKRTTKRFATAPPKSVPRTKSNLTREMKNLRL